MKTTFVILRLLLLASSVLFAGVSLFPSSSKASFCPTTCGPVGPIACNGPNCRRPE
jgi:hypothetical protein